MHSSLDEHSGLAFNLFLGISAAAFLMILASGIAMSNVVAAVIAGAGLAVIIVVGGTINLVPDSMRSQATERTLSVASNTLRQLRGGLTPTGCEAICALLLPETTAMGIAMTDTTHVIAYSGDYVPVIGVGDSNSAPTLEVLSSKRIETFAAVDSEDQRYSHFIQGSAQPGQAFGIIAPLLVQDRAVGTLKLYYRRGLDIDRTQIVVAQGFADLLSAQLSSYELDKQAELTAKAEVKALQAQINPHFLFNTLNTIASLTRTDPARARDLLREFSVFYRRTLENSDSIMPLSRELEQTKRYLTIEKARFGEDRIVEVEHVEPGCEALPMPAFIVQPIVENAVRHAMSDEGALHIDIHVATDGNDILIAVADDGLGMGEDVARKLLEPAPASSDAKGTGIALRNVAERIEKFYGVGSGVEIVSKLDEGTCVTLRLADAVSLLGTTGTPG